MTIDRDEGIILDLAAGLGAMMSIICRENDHLIKGTKYEAGSYKDIAEMLIEHPDLRIKRSSLLICNIYLDLLRDL